MQELPIWSGDSNSCDCRAGKGDASPQLVSHSCFTGSCSSCLAPAWGEPLRHGRTGNSGKPHSFTTSQWGDGRVLSEPTHKRTHVLPLSQSRLAGGRGKGAGCAHHGGRNGTQSVEGDHGTSHCWHSGRERAGIEKTLSHVPSLHLCC